MAIDTFCTFQLHTLQSVLDKFRVDFQRYLIVQHTNLDRSIQDLQLLLVIHTKSNVAGLFHLESFLMNPSKCSQLFPSSQYTEIVTMTQTFQFSIVTTAESKGSSWNSLSTLLTMCLPKLTLRLAFHSTCFCRVWPTCPSVHGLQADMCKSTCELHCRNVLSTHPTLPFQTDHLQGFRHHSSWT